ncbi:DNA polymerase delta subunit 4 [Lithobates pipiens]
MGRKRKLTDCLPVVKHAEESRKRAERRGKTPVKGEAEQTQPAGGKAKRKTLKNEKQDSGDPTTRGSSHIDAVEAPPPKLTPLEKLVRFDLDWNFGPCTGISRMERWQRAQNLDLMPPQDIKQILLAHSSDPQYQHNLWSSYAI